MPHVIVPLDTVRLRVEIKKRGWNVKELAKKAGVSFQAIYYVLAGKRRCTDKMHLKLAKALGMAPVHLLQGEWLRMAGDRLQKLADDEDAPLNAWLNGVFRLHELSTAMTPPVEEEEMEGAVDVADLFGKQEGDG